MIAGSSAPDPELRREARFLLKRLRRGSAEERRAAAQRFLRLQSLAGSSIDALAADSSGVRLKHALAVVASEHGFDSWTLLKAAADRAPSAGPSEGSPEMYEPGFDVLLNAWFARYDEARRALERHGGFLLPYRSQFLVCEAEGIRLLGLDPEDPDWELIGRDWVRPADADAWARLRDLRNEAIDRGDRA